MALNKNQHFVPRCYLKAFTCGEENAAINLFNIDRMRAIPAAPVKNQCSGDYFYGQDASLEDATRFLEAGYAAAVRRIHSPGHKLTTVDRTVLKMFMLFQYMRTEAASKRSVEMFAGMEGAIHAQGSGLKPSMKDVVQIAMRTFADSTYVVEDLKVCLLRNRTGRPFVTSDDPAAMTNRWHFEDRRARSKTPGLIASGLLLILPLSPRVTCFAYDCDVYSVPHQDGWADVKHERDIAAINEHQFMNASANIYFRDWDDRDWVAAGVQAVVQQRQVRRHKVTVAVFDKEVGDHERFLVVDPAELKEGDRAIVHSETMLRRPSSWPRQLQWHPKGVVFSNGTRAGFVREGQIQHRKYGGFRREAARP